MDASQAKRIFGDGLEKEKTMTFESWLNQRGEQFPSYVWDIVKGIDKGVTSIGGLKCGKYTLNRLWFDYQREQDK